MSSQIPRYECGPFLKRAHLPKIVCDFTERSLWYNFFQWDLSFHFRKPIPPTDAFLVCSVFKIESPLTLTRVLMGLQSTVIYRTCTLNTYCKFSISISRGVEKKKNSPIRITQSHQHKHYSSCPSGFPENYLKNPLILWLHLWQPRLFPHGNLKQFSDCLWCLCRGRLEVHPGMVFIVHQDVQNILRPFDFIIEEIAWSICFEMAQIQDYTTVEFQADNNS